MFLDNLSISLLQLCKEKRLTYESASELCDLSSRYFGDIARGHAAPTIVTLEKLCDGLQATPNELLLPNQICQQLSFRQPMLVIHIRCYHEHDRVTIFPVCPKCGISLEREYQAFCDRCGQRLDWSSFSSAVLLPSQK